MHRLRIEDLGAEYDDRAAIHEHQALIDRQYVVRHEDEFVTSFDPEEGDTLTTVLRHLVTGFQKPHGQGYDYTDMVVWRNRRIVAVVRQGSDGNPIATVF